MPDCLSLYLSFCLSTLQYDIGHYNENSILHGFELLPRCWKEIRKQGHRLLLCIIIVQKAGKQKFPSLVSKSHLRLRYI